MTTTNRGKLISPTTGKPTKLEPEEISEWVLRQIDKGIEDADQGRVIPREEVVEWLRSWRETGVPTPPPKCCP